MHPGRRRAPWLTILVAGLSAAGREIGYPAGTESGEVWPLVRRTASAPTIDGRVEPVWASADGLALRPREDRPPPHGSYFNATVRTLWDEDHLYLLIEHKDIAREAGGSGFVEIALDPETLAPVAPWGSAPLWSTAGWRLLLSYRPDQEGRPEDGRAGFWANPGAVGRATTYQGPMATTECAIPWAILGIAGTELEAGQGLDLGLRCTRDTTGATEVVWGWAMPRALPAATRATATPPGRVRLGPAGRPDAELWAKFGDYPRIDGVYATELGMVSANKAWGGFAWYESFGEWWYVFGAREGTATARQYLAWAFGRQRWIWFNGPAIEEQGELVGGWYREREDSETTWVWREYRWR